MMISPSNRQRQQRLAGAPAMDPAHQPADNVGEALVLDAGQDVLPAVGLERRVADALGVLAVD